MTLHTSIKPQVSVFDDRLGSYWRHNLRAVREHLDFIPRHLRTIEKGTERPAYLDQCRKTLAIRIPSYLRAVRAVSEAEAKMDVIGMEYARDSNDWRMDADLVAVAFGEAA